MTRKREIRQRRSGRMFDEVASEWLSRRMVLEGVLGATIVSFFSGSNVLRRAWARSESALLGFTGVPTSRADTVTVPPEYTWTVVNAWGDPIVTGGPDFRADASQSAADQALQAGMHHDGMHFFPLPKGSNASTHGHREVEMEIRALVPRYLAYRPRTIRARTHQKLWARYS